MVWSGARCFCGFPMRGTNATRCRHFQCRMEHCRGEHIRQGTLIGTILHHLIGRRHAERVFASTHMPKLLVVPLLLKPLHHRGVVHAKSLPENRLQPFPCPDRPSSLSESSSSLLPCQRAVDPSSGVRRERKNGPTPIRHQNFENRQYPTLTVPSKKRGNRVVEKIKILRPCSFGPHFVLQLNQTVVRDRSRTERIVWGAILSASGEDGSRFKPSKPVLESNSFWSRISRE